MAIGPEVVFSLEFVLLLALPWIAGFFYVLRHAFMTSGKHGFRAPSSNSTKCRGSLCPSNMTPAPSQAVQPMPKWEDALEPGQVRPRSWMEVDLSAVRHNFNVVRQQSGLPIMAVVKANAYGHGIERVAACIDNEPDITFFGVAQVVEARRLEACGIKTPIFLLGPCNDGERTEVVSRHWTATVSSLEEAESYSAVGASLKTFVDVHINIDTGMGRAGFLLEDVMGCVDQLASLPWLRFRGIMSHFAAADDDDAATRQQVADFDRGVSFLKDKLRRDTSAPFYIHVQNSAGVLGEYRSKYANMVRSGLMMYGVTPMADSTGRNLLRPAMSLKASVSLVRTLPAGSTISYGKTHSLQQATTVATVGIGYADGYSRSLSNTGVKVFIRGKPCTVLGKVTMDQLVCDVSEVPNIQCGDEVECFGPNISCDAVAQLANTVPWEVMTMASQARGGRLYVDIPRQVDNVSQEPEGVAECRGSVGHDWPLSIDVC